MGRLLLKNCFSFFKRIAEFWIKDSFIFLKEKLEKIIFRLEKIFAIKVNFYYLFSPLYQDYSALGYFFGFSVRFFKILVGLVFYLSLILVFLVVYLIFLAFPFFLVYLSF